MGNPCRALRELHEVAAENNRLLKQLLGRSTPGEGVLMWKREAQAPSVRQEVRLQRGARRWNGLLATQLSEREAQQASSVR